MTDASRSELTAPAAFGGRLQCTATRWDPAGTRPVRQTVIDEVPVALVYNGVSHAVMLASPTDLEDFAIGFSLTEGIARSASDIYDLEILEGNGGIEVHVTLAASRMAALGLRRRTLAGRSGCGLCGAESLAQALLPVPTVLPGGCLDSAALASAIAQLNAGQALHQATGAAHAAAFALWSGELKLMREDIGRHNALDKLAGAMAGRDMNGAEGFAIVTSRASYEMVHKTAAARIGVLAALSAPTSMAIRAADAAGVTLIGFAARASCLVFTHPERLAVTAVPVEEAR